jgi:hypothetical protein
MEVVESQQWQPAAAHSLELILFPQIRPRSFSRGSESMLNDWREDFLELVGELMTDEEFDGVRDEVGVSIVGDAGKLFKLRSRQILALPDPRLSLYLSASCFSCPHVLVKH